MTTETSSEALELAEREAAAEAEAAAFATTEEGAEGPSSADYSVAFSPRQVAVGLAIVAGLVAVLAARRRRRTRADESDGG